MNSELYNQAVRFLARRAHGRQELEKKLRRKAPPAEVDEVLDALEGRGYLNDEEFAWIRARSKRLSSLWGNRQIALDLNRLGVNARIIERTLEKVEEELPEGEALRRTAASWIRISGSPGNIKDLKRLFDHCLRRGYSPEQVRTELQQYFDQVNWH